MTQYTLTLVNRSASNGSFTIFQKPPAGMANAVLQAWLTKSADPNTQVAVEWAADDPGPGYWIAFGAFMAGEVLDPDAAANAVEVAFPGSTTSHTVTLGPDNVLSVTA
ncbi:MAG TPA: hypothetical protein VGM96_26260 [Reyranella sp.]|jgi:hypothetical protein